MGTRRALTMGRDATMTTVNGYTIEPDFDLYTSSPIVPCVYCNDGTLGCVVCNDTGLMVLDTVTEETTKGE
jgi:hypothetical protein